jgi:hypothetical protein
MYKSQKLPALIKPKRDQESAWHSRFWFSLKSNELFQTDKQVRYFFI